MSREYDAQVMRSALQTHLTYLQTTAWAHRAAGRALSQRPEQPDLLRAGQSPIAVSAAHRARGASFGQRAEFVEQLLDFPVAGLRALGPNDMRSLQVPAHIGAAALPAEVAQAVTEREAAARLNAARPVTRPSAEPAPAEPQPAPPPAAEPSPAVPVPPKKRKPWHRHSFEDILYGHK